MNLTILIEFLTYALPSGFLSGLVTWQVSRRKRNNDLLCDMQQSIDLLCEKYNAVLQENVTLRQEKAGWLVAQQELLLKIDKLTREVEGLRRNIDRKTKEDEIAKQEKSTRAALRRATAGRVRLHDANDTNLLPAETSIITPKRRKIAARQPLHPVSESQCSLDADPADAVRTTLG